MINESFKVNSTMRNFTIAPTSKFFVNVVGTKNAVYGQFAGKIKFRYYTYDPNCATFTYWNGTDCEPNYFEYCSNLTAEYQNKTNDPKTFVFYNGTSCVISNSDKS
jgi:hypothetical protein